MYSSCHDRLSNICETDRAYDSYHQCLKTQYPWKSGGERGEHLYAVIQPVMLIYCCLCCKYNIKTVGVIGFSSQRPSVNLAHCTMKVNEWTSIIHENLMWCAILSKYCIECRKPPPPRKRGGRQVKTKTDVATLMKMQIEPNIKPWIS